MTMSVSVKKMSAFPVHLGLDARAIAQSEFTGALSWYEDYGQKNAKDGKEGRLVSFHTFQEPWGMWEMHPEGDEVVVCVKGTCTLIQEINGKPISFVLQEGEYVINPKGVWHTADVDAPATVLFITAGLGTQHRKRDL